MAKGYLTTHVLDTAQGRPAGGMRVTLWRIDGANRMKLAQATTNADGRTDAPILPQGQCAPGRYELVFEAGAWLDAQNVAGDSPRFLDEIPIRFGIADTEAHVHVPLLLSAHGYTTYRGS